ncbi:uncharacterized protein V6R79_019870 [Siganus canaliculatus]
MIERANESAEVMNGGMDEAGEGEWQLARSRATRLAAASRRLSTGRAAGKSPAPPAQAGAASVAPSEMAAAEEERNGGAEHADAEKEDAGVSIKETAEVVYDKERTVQLEIQGEEQIPALELMRDETEDSGADGEDGEPMELQTGLAATVGPANKDAGVAKNADLAGEKAGMAKNAGPAAKTAGGAKNADLAEKNPSSASSGRAGVVVLERQPAGSSSAEAIGPSMDGLVHGASQAAAADSEDDNPVAHWWNDESSMGTDSARGGQSEAPEAPESVVFDSSEMNVEEREGDVLLSGVANRLCPEDKEALDGPITEDEVLIAIEGLARRKSPGEDGITAEVYLYARQLLAPVLCGVFNDMVKPLMAALEAEKGLKGLPVSPGSGRVAVVPYADDVTILASEAGEVEKALRLVEAYERASGAKLNRVFRAL